MSNPPKSKSSRLVLRKTEAYQRIAAMDALLFPADLPIENWENTSWWIGTVGGEEACYCGIQNWGSGVHYLRRAGVLEKFQGNGFQKKMLKQRLSSVPSGDVIVTDTSPSNYASINSLIASGFRIYLPQNPWVGEPALFWRLQK